MFRVKDTNLTDEQLLALVGQLVKIEYAYRESTVMAGDGNTAVGIVTKVDLVPMGTGSMSRIYYRSLHNDNLELWMRGSGYCTLYFTTPEDA